MFICSFCGREFATKIGVKTHEYKCKENPLHEEHIKKYSNAIKKAFKNRSKPTKYFEFTTVCEKCGQEFTQLTTPNIIKRNKHKRYCSQACSHSRNHSELTKNKTKNTLSRFYDEQRKNRFDSVLKSGSIESLGKLARAKANRSNKINKHNCHFCGKEVYGKFETLMYCYDCAEKNDLKNLQLYTPEGKTIPSKKKIESAKSVQNRLITEGRHKGWQSRNLVSYPERFWKEVLENNNIEYSFNHVVKKKELGLNDMSNYFLDFLIDNRIDLEIDGKQHKYPDRIESDKLRDSLLTKAGYIVYRIPWNEIKSEQGQNKMKEKIQSFLNFYKQHKNNI